MITPSYGLTATERVLPRLALDWTTGLAQPGVNVTRAGVATFVGSNGLIQPASVNTQRLDYSTGTAGLLVEESRTNVITYSEDLANAIWNKSWGAGVTVTPNQANGPDGLANLDLVTSSGINGGLYQICTLTLNAAHTVSCFIKQGTSSLSRLQIFNPVAGNIASVVFTWVDGVPSTSTTSGSPTNIVYTDWGGGLYELTFTFTSNGATAAHWTVYVPDNTGAASLLTGFAGYLQLEQGAFATSYIPTEATAVTRNADVATMTGTNFSDWWQASKGGVLVRARPGTVSGTRPWVQFDDNTADNIIALRGNTTNPELYIVDGGTPQAQIDAGTIAANTAYNLGAAWDTDNCAAAVNGGVAVTDTTATIPTVTQARLGSDGTNYLNGQIQTVRYWPQRIINAEVEAFSK